MVPMTMQQIFLQASADDEDDTQQQQQQQQQQQGNEEGPHNPDVTAARDGGGLEVAEIRLPMLAGTTMWQLLGQYDEHEIDISDRSPSPWDGP